MTAVFDSGVGTSLTWQIRNQETQIIPDRLFGKIIKRKGGAWEQKDDLVLVTMKTYPYR